MGPSFRQHTIVSLPIPSGPIKSAPARRRGCGSCPPTYALRRLSPGVASDTSGGGCMPLFGAHMSIAGGYHKALLLAQKQGCNAVQLFTKSSNQWRAKDLTEADIQTFQATLRGSPLRL